MAKSHENLKRRKRSSMKSRIAPHGDLDMSRTLLDEGILESELRQKKCDDGG